MQRLMRWLTTKAIKYLPVVHGDDLANEKLAVLLLQQRLAERGSDVKRMLDRQRKLNRALTKANSQLRGKAGQVKKMAKELYANK